MRTIYVRDISATVKAVRIQGKNTEQDKKKIRTIIEDVRRNGDNAIKKWDKKFSKLKNTNHSLKISENEIRTAYSKVRKDEINAITLAKKRLERSEFLLKNKLGKTDLLKNGLKMAKVFVPFEIVGCYIPGGMARYPSTVVMSAIPAKVAGVKKIVAVSPPNEFGSIDPLVLVAADICGVDEFYKTGGPQAVAALAYGTKSIPKVDKIVGPGGSFVTLAKLLVSENVSIDMIAGPTELAIIADSTADPLFITYDLISQAEHGPQSMCCLITTSIALKDKVLALLKQRISKIKRSEFVEKSLKNNGFVAICKTESQLAEFANKLAPEHLEIITKNPQKIAQKITSAGLVLIGKNTPSSASDYVLGSNHILPTNGFANVRGSLGVLDFMKIQTRIETSKDELEKISKYVKTLTDSEGLPNHYEAVRCRLE